MAKKIDNQEKLVKATMTAIRKFGQSAYITPDGFAVRGEMSYLYHNIPQATVPGEMVYGLQFAARDLPDCGFSVDMENAQIAFGAQVRKAEGGREFPRPDLWSFADDGSVTVTSSGPFDFYADLAAVLPACAKEDNRPTLMRVAVQFANGQYLRSVGADGFRLALRGDETTPEDETILMEPEIAKFLSSKAIDRNGGVYILQGGDHIAFLARLIDGREVALVQRNDQGRYPQVISLIPQNCQNWYSVNAEPIQAAIKESAPIWRAANETFAVSFNGACKVLAVSQDKGRFETDMPYFGLKQGDNATWVNARYLADAIGSTGKTIVGLNTRANPIVVLPEDGTLWVVMPMSTR